MAQNGFSPATRVFEAAGAGACIITDKWEGIDNFFEPEQEIYVADSADEVVNILERLTPQQAATVGARALKRVKAEHTYAHRAGSSKQFLTQENRNGGRMKLAVLGLSITSSWGNGHATTYRGLLREMARLGHEVTFFERDVPWYAQHRDLPEPPFCRTFLYTSKQELFGEYGRELIESDSVIVGSYVPDGIEIGTWVTRKAKGVTAFYDIDTPVTLAKLEDGTCRYLSIPVQTTDTPLPSLSLVYRRPNPRQGRKKLWITGCTTSLLFR